MFGDSDSAANSGDDSTSEEALDSDHDHCLEAIFVKKPTEELSSAVTGKEELDPLKSHHATTPTKKVSDEELKADSQYNFHLQMDENGNRATRNLHVSGYGSETTPGKLKDLFAQYATVIEVVPKAGNLFCFVNTRHREEAIQARQHLDGTELNGGKLKINFAKE